MKENEKKPAPKFRGNLEVSAWEKLDKNGKPYLSVKISNFVNLFEVEGGK